jgi:hypothetical protein
MLPNEINQKKKNPSLEICVSKPHNVPVTCVFEESSVTAANVSVITEVRQSQL